MTLLFAMVGLAALGLSWAAVPLFVPLKRSRRPLVVRRMRRVRVPLGLAIAAGAVGAAVIVGFAAIVAEPRTIMVYAGSIFILAIVVQLVPRRIATGIVLVTMLVPAVPFTVYRYWAAGPLAIELDYSEQGTLLCNSDLIQRAGADLPAGAESSLAIWLDAGSPDWTRAGGLAFSLARIPSPGSDDNACVPISADSTDLELEVLSLADFIWWTGSNRFVRISGFVGPAPDAQQVERTISRVVAFGYRLMVRAGLVRRDVIAISLSRPDEFVQPGGYRILIDTRSSADNQSDDDHIVPSGE